MHGIDVTKKTRLKFIISSGFVLLEFLDLFIRNTSQNTQPASLLNSECDSPSPKPLPTKRCAIILGHKQVSVFCVSYQSQPLIIE